MPAHALHIVGGRVRERLAVSVGQFPDDPARHPGNENAGRQVGPWQYDGSGGDQRASPDTGAPEHYRANADERAGLDVRAVHGSAVPKADPFLQYGWLTRIDVQAAQVLDVALGADHDLRVIRAEHRPVPDRGRAAEGDLPDEHGARSKPGIRMNNRAVITQ